MNEVTRATVYAKVLEVFFDEQHRSKVKDMTVEKTTALFNLWNLVNSRKEVGKLMNEEEAYEIFFED